MREISLSDYQVGSQFGNSNSGELNELLKALNAGSITGRETTDLTNASGAALKVESLENTLKVLTFKESDIQVWKLIPKLPAYNTVEEYNELSNYGEDRGGFNNEGELPEEEDSTYTRRAQLVKFMGTTRSLSHPMQLVNTMIGSAMQQEIKNGTMWILRKANKAVVGANSKYITQEFNGLYAQHENAIGGGNVSTYYDSANVIDLRGKNLRDTNIEDAALTIIENYGEASMLMAAPKVLSNYVKNFHESKLIQPNSAQVSAGEMGQKVKSSWTQFGSIDLGYDKFMKVDAPITTTKVATHAKAPNAPVAGTAPAAVADAVSSKFASFTGDYYYVVTAVNRYGESAPVALGALVTVASTESIDLTFTDGGGAIAATAYRIYRTKPVTGGAASAQTYYPLFTVAVSELAAGYDGGVATKVRDRNRILPGTDSSFIMEPSQDIWSFKQLAPLMKMDLAQTGPATRFMVLMYGTPVVYAPKKIVKLINIGTDLT